MVLKIWIYFFLHQTMPIFTWDLNIYLSQRISVGDSLQIICTVTGDSQYSPIFLYCPINQQNSEYLCFEDCRKQNDNNKFFSNLNCQYNMNNNMKSLIYFISKFDESWLAFNNSYFKCKFMDRVVSAPFIIQDKKAITVAQYFDIIIVIGLLLISLSFNVAFCSWKKSKTSKKRHEKLMKKVNKMDTPVQSLNDESTIERHKRKSYSLDLSRREEMKTILRRNQSVILLPLLVPTRVLSSTASVSSYNSRYGNEYYGSNRQNKLSEKLDANFIKLNQQIQNNPQPEQVSSFKSAMDNKMCENLTDILIQE